MQYMYIHGLFVCNEVLKGGIQGYSLCFIAKQPMLQLKPFACKLARASIRSEL